MQPLLVYRAREGEDLTFDKVNADVSPQVSQRFGAQAIPTLLVLRGGRAAARQTGAVPLAALRAWADNALATSPP